MKSDYVFGVGFRFFCFGSVDFFGFFAEFLWWCDCMCSSLSVDSILVLGLGLRWVVFCWRTYGSSCCVWLVRIVSLGWLGFFGLLLFGSCGEIKVGWVGFLQVLCWFCMVDCSVF